MGRAKWHSRFPVTRTLYNSNIPLTGEAIFISIQIIVYNFTLDNSNFFLSPLKVRIIESQL